jgi:acetate kinase
MLILVLNCGSTSIKAAVLDPSSGARRVSARAERLGEPEARIVIRGTSEILPCPKADHFGALEIMLPGILAMVGEAEIVGVGHRVVHGGARFVEPVRIDDDMETAIDELSSLAPLHNPVNLAGIRAARRLLPKLPHVAVFDTAFHSTMPRRARTYAISRPVADKLGLRRYGFHGPSHAFVANLAADHLKSELRHLRIITCHLGGGCSVAAVEYGRSVDTSMGMTPMEGLVMGTRSGDVDPGIALELLRQGYDVDALDRLLNRESGLAGLSGVGGDLRDIEARAADGDDGCRLAIAVFAHRVRKYIGAYAAVMGGADAIVLTAGIGENSALMRNRIAQRLEFLGAILDDDRNRDARVSREQPVVEISAPHSRTRLLVAATDEAHAIARDSARLVLELDRVSGQRNVPVAISARHVHLTQATVERLFGPGHQLTPVKPLSQPGQFASAETVTLVGPKRSITGVRILGPTRSRDQVEIARTDEFFLGIDAPVRASGDVKNTPGITLEGPAGQVHIPEGVICSWRHIHMHPTDAEYFGVKHLDVVDVEIDSQGRDLVFRDVLVRVKESYALELHLDTDEGNACELERGMTGELIPTRDTATLTRRRSSFDRPH